VALDERSGWFFVLGTVAAMENNEETKRHWFNALLKANKEHKADSR
jgi:hypothetical protein